MIVVPKSQLKRFAAAGRKFAKDVGGSGDNLHLTPEQYATLQTHRIVQQNPVRSMGTIPDDYDPETSASSPRQGSCCDPPKRR